MNVRFFESHENGTVRCRVCPHDCTIAPGNSGICGTRRNFGGSMELPYYGRLSAQAVDPIEKKPLYHFYPGSKIFSVGFWGCSFKCPFCQNYNISQSVNASEYVSPETLVELAIAHGSFGIAYTYSEPLIHIEYLLDTCKIARTHGLANVLVSNGYVNQEPAAELLSVLDAANIDLKAFNPGFYKREIGGGLEDVKRFIAEAARNIHLEVTTLVIPGKNSDDEEIAGIAEFLASIDPGIPYHLSCYYPTYRYTLPPTSAETVFRLASIAKEYLRYVYCGNVGLMDSHTICPDCGRVLIERVGYSTRITGVKQGKCAQCSRPISLHGKREP